MINSTGLMLPMCIRSNPRSGFSLVEVVVAVGIFAIAVIALVGLLIPINGSIAEIRDGDDAARVAQVVQTELQKATFADVQSFIANGTVLYATRTGSIVGPDTDTRWDADGSGLPLSPEEAAEKFFRITLDLNDSLSPNGDNAAYAGGFLAFTVSLRWPGYTANGVQITQDDQQSILVMPAAITR